MLELEDKLNQQLHDIKLVSNFLGNPATTSQQASLYEY